MIARWQVQYKRLSPDQAEALDRWYQAGQCWGIGYRFQVRDQNEDEKTRRVRRQPSRSKGVLRKQIG